MHTLISICEHSPIFQHQGISFYVKTYVIKKKGPLPAGLQEHKRRFQIDTIQHFTANNAALTWSLKPVMIRQSTVHF